MSINMTNPKTLLEIIDAAANHVAQIRLASMIGDRAHVDKALSEAERLLSLASEKAEQLNEP